MVSLTVAPLMTVKEGSEIKDIDWNKWYFGIIPIVLFIVVMGMIRMKGTDN